MIEKGQARPLIINPTKVSQSFSEIPKNKEGPTSRAAKD